MPPECINDHEIDKCECHEHRLGQRKQATDPSPGDQLTDHDERRRPDQGLRHEASQQIIDQSAKAPATVPANTTVVLPESVNAGTLPSICAMTRISIRPPIPRIAVPGESHAGGLVLSPIVHLRPLDNTSLLSLRFGVRVAVIPPITPCPGKPQDESR